MAQAIIFIIHPEKDEEILKKIVCQYHDQTFGKTTLKVRFISSKAATHLGQNFGDEIKQTIDLSQHVIAIVTPKSRKSEWVNQEIGYAIGTKKEIYPVKKKSMADRGIGFIHSNIDAQIYRPRQQKFRKLDEFFEGKYGKKTVNVLKKPVFTKPTREDARVPTRGVIPSYVV